MPQYQAYQLKLFRRKLEDQDNDLVIPTGSNIFRYTPIFSNPSESEPLRSINVNDPDFQSDLGSFDYSTGSLPYFFPANKPYTPHEEEEEEDDDDEPAPTIPSHSTVHRARESELWLSELLSTILQNMALGFLLRSVLRSTINNSKDFVKFMLCSVFQAQPVIKAIYDRIGLNMEILNGTWEQNTTIDSLPGWKLRK